MKRVLVFGTFDLIHPGHVFFLEQAKQHGDELVVVIARDDTVRAVKHRDPIYSDESRMRLVSSLKVVDLAVLGGLGDKIQIVIDTLPDVIVLGYDQVAFTEKLQQRLAEAGLSPDIIRLTESLDPTVYKSSRIRESFINKQGKV